MRVKQPVGLATMLRAGVIAGAAGGLAEVAWVSLYAVSSGADAGAVSRGVTTAVGAMALLPDNAVVLGIVIHMAIAVALGAALAAAWQALSRFWPSGRPQYAFVLAALVAVWATNFFVILPIVSPDFVSLVPYAVSFISKLAFGLAAAETLRRCAAGAARVGYARIGA
jgi:hypothetical protein